MNSHTQHDQLARRCIDGDRHAQFELYKLYSKAMFNVCLRILGNRVEAEDELQNAFIDVFAKLSSFRFESSVGAWIKRIVVNQCINALKKKRVIFFELQNNQPEVESDEYKPEADKSQEIAKIRTAVSQLPDGYRTIFSLYAMEGYDHQEISQILDISVGTSKSQYSRARQRLCHILQDKMD
ncbi:MAG: RNA polymerase sigma factor [Saprospiraceae bacterium]|nr:RNA polymerase sigma factor [Saprospiraceae bacterium]